MDWVNDFSCAMILFMFLTGTIHLYTSTNSVSFVGSCFYESPDNHNETFSISLDSEEGDAFCSVCFSHSAIFRNTTESGYSNRFRGSYLLDPVPKPVLLFL